MVLSSNKSASFYSLIDRVAVIILGGGEGKRLFPLTQTRCKPAISFGGRYTLIDIPISHALLTGLRKIYVIGQYLAYSLQKHIAKTYSAYGEVHMLVPEERRGNKIWYDGTADAVRKNLEYFHELNAEYFLILSGDQLYNINFLEMIEQAVKTNADLLIASKMVTENEAKRMGVMKLEGRGTKILSFYEKPQERDTLNQYVQPEGYLASMGIYLFKRDALFSLLHEDTRSDFGKHLIGTQLAKGNVHAYQYKGYWEDIGTIDSFYNANLALTKQSKVGLQCYDEAGAIITKNYHLPGAKIENCLINQSLICEGSIVGAGEISSSIIGVRSVIKQSCVIKDSILMGNSYYKRASHAPTIHERCHIEKAIIDENVTIGSNVRLLNRHGYRNYDDPSGLFFVRDGITIVPSGTILPNNFSF